MDLRTIMNTDATGTASAASAPSQQSPSRAESVYPPRQPQPATASPASSASSYPPGYNAQQQPSQPAPLQRSRASPERSSSYGSIQSPYQPHSTAAVSAGAQPQRGQSPPPPPPPPPAYASASSRDSYSAPTGYSNQQHASTARLASPYTPQPASSAGPFAEQQQQSYFAQQRSQSIQSVLSPQSAPSHSFHPRESPSVAPQSHPSQQFSPPAHGSLPGTPRASAVSSLPRQTPPSTRPPSSGHDSHSNRASSPWVGQDAQMHMSPTAMPRGSRQNSRHREQTPRQLPPGGERRTSDESVSPKTAFTPGSRQGSMTGTSEHKFSSQLNYVEDGVGKEDSSAPVMTSSQSPMAVMNARPPPAVSQFDSSPSAQSHKANGSLTGDRAQTYPTKMDMTPDSRPDTGERPLKRRRRRYNEPPIFAQRAARVKGRCPVIPDPHPPIPKHLRDSAQSPFAPRRQSVSSHTPTATALPPPTARVKSETPPTNGPVAARLPSAPTVPAPMVPAPSEGSLGPWEPSITGFIPHEEITKLVCDFLFQHVVLRNDATAGPAGTAAVGQGTIIEVEGKLGHIIDMDRGERVNLPILTESVINKENPRFRTAFESSMTVSQHRAMNNFLNEAVKASMPQTNPGRIPLSYAHKKERDTFYEISPSELPPVIRQNLNPRHKPKVRVTIDQRTGEVLAKIVKCRIADMDVHSPRTCVDWRISVNLEMTYDGDVSHLTMVDSSRGSKSGDRTKDRMSYRHLAYQVDLTQVAKSEPPTKGDFEHELEVEVSAAEVRRQGQLAMAGDPQNQYEELVKGFVDNIRLLARAVPP
ncbi:putative mRNA capping nucleoside-triphosphatase [Aspergillus clavatus NRRL 1]|uniref:mRNA-capping enzyme subunit beta n=1 Tax=Aspergillus clavatus (strain ATCC 1007 / CBS 513.65 / DSM 816 / NCTC 3887 / NRRL 1 / QM 1276 / 107) TaxID=344612 RepID=A1CHG3_ASPCL|nr:mRNA capping nucleoside-triphosphatase, putative [Aspergillus clavatus NRRL 1]EAW10318.1 mRNA capping nucleoside-triphosphatase, putative [Aspergillus clavatus NRRL 1]